MTEYYKILRIADAIDNISNGQIACEATAHPIIGVRAWGGKDHAGNVTRFLALNKPGQLSTLNLSGPTTSGNSGILVHDAAGDVSGGKMTIDEFNDYLSDGPIGVYDAGDGIDITDFVVSNTGVLSVGKDEPVTGAITLTGGGVVQTGNTFTITGYASGSFDHGGLQGLGDDDHTQYIRVSGTRAFTDNQSMGANDLTNIRTLSGSTTLGLSNSYFAASDWTGDMPLSSSSDEINTLLGFAGGEVSLFGALNLGITAITDDNGVTQVKGAPLAIYAGNSILISKVQAQEGFENGFRFDYNPEGVHIAPVSINTAIGTPTGSLSGILTINDGSVYHVDETTGSPALIVNIGWGDITSFNRIVLRLWYHGTAPLHTMSVQLQNFATPGFDEFKSVSLSAGYQVLSFEVPNPSDYINSGAVTLRLYHDAAGSTAHDLDIDYASMIVGTGGGVVSMQGAYDGGNSIFMSSGNAGPVVINSGTEASPCLWIAQTQAAFSSYVGRIDNASTSDDSYGLQFIGDAGGDGTAAFQYGHRVWTEDSVITIGRSQTTENFVGDAFFRARSVPHPTTGSPYRQEASIVAWDAYGGADYAWVTAYTTYSPNGAPAGVQGSYIELRCSGIMYVEAPEVDLNQASAITNATSCTFGNQGAATFATGVITAIYSGTEKCIKKVTVDANVTNVKLTPPHGSGVVILRVLASGTRTITNFTKADGTTPCVTWKNDIDPDAGALTIPTGTTATFSLLYDETADNYEGWVSLDV